MIEKLANTRLLIIAAIATFLGVMWWATREQDAQVESVDAAVPATSPDPAGLPAGGLPSPAPANAVSVVDEDAVFAETSFRKYVTDKYRYLFRGSTLSPAANEALQEALVERERIAVAIRTVRQSDDETMRTQLSPLQAQIMRLDEKVGGLLPAGAITAFDLLKDSDTEQYQLEDYAGGISNVAPVSDDDKQSILITKLTYRNRFRRVLEDSRLMNGELTAEQRKSAFGEVSRELKRSRDSYLQEVRQYLYNDEQFQLLSNYENTEYTEELAKLRRIAYGE